MTALKRWIFVLIFNFAAVHGDDPDLAAVLGEDPVTELTEKKFAKDQGNPGYLRDREKENKKPLMPESFKNRFKQPFNKAWMDYCAPYHCNDYHKQACGANRRNKKFKWFQSACHLILANQCSQYRGTIKYDIVDDKHCDAHVLYLRLGCDTHCDQQAIDPICAVSLLKGNFVLFKHKCGLDAANCQSGTIEEYEPASMELCEYQKQTTARQYSKGELLFSVPYGSGGYPSQGNTEKNPVAGQTATGRYFVPGQSDIGGFSASGHGGYPVPAQTHNGGYPVPGQMDTGGYSVPGQSDIGGYPVSGQAYNGGYPVPRQTDTGGYSLPGKRHKGGYLVPGQTYTGGYPEPYTWANSVPGQMHMG